MNVRPSTERAMLTPRRLPDPPAYPDTTPIADDVVHMTWMSDNLSDTQLRSVHVEKMQKIAAHTAEGAVPVGLVQLAFAMRRARHGGVKDAAHGMIDGWKERGALKDGVPAEEMKGYLKFRREGESLVLLPTDKRWDFKEVQAKAEELAQLPQEDLDRELESLGYGIYSYGEAGVIYTALAKAGDNLAFRNRLQPHRENLLKAREQARLEKPLHYPHQAYSHQLTTAFPDLLTPEFVAHELKGLMGQHDSHNVPETLGQWWKKNPELVAPSLDEVVKLDTDRHLDKFAKLFNTALTKYGYKPNSETLGWMVGKTMKQLSLSGCPTELLDCLSEVRERFPEMYEKVGIGPSRRPLEDIVFEQLTDERGILANRDDDFRGLLSPHLDEPKAFSRFVKLEERKEVLLNRARHRLSQENDLYKAGHDTLQAIGLLARLSPQDPQLQKDLLGVLGIVDLNMFRNVQEFTLKLFQGQVLEEQLKDFSATKDNLGSKAALLLNSAKAVDKPLLKDRVLQLWSGSMSEFGMPVAVRPEQSMEDCLENFIAVDNLTSQVPIERRWARFQNHLTLADGKREGALELLEYDTRLAEGNQELHPQLWRQFEALTQRSQGDFKQNQALFEFYRTRLNLGEMNPEQRWARVEEHLTLAGEDPVKAKRVSELEAGLRRSGQFEEQWPHFRGWMQTHGLEEALLRLDLQAQLDASQDSAIEIEMEDDAIWIGDHMVEMN